MAYPPPCRRSFPKLHESFKGSKRPQDQYHNDATWCIHRPSPEICRYDCAPVLCQRQTQTSLSYPSCYGLVLSQHTVYTVDRVSFHRLWLASQMPFCEPTPLCEPSTLHLHADMTTGEAPGGCVIAVESLVRVTRTPECVNWFHRKDPLPLLPLLCCCCCVQHVQFLFSLPYVRVFVH